jgi:hypothetical protein
VSGQAAGRVRRRAGTRAARSAAKRAAQEPAKVIPKRPPARGWFGRGGGAALTVEAAPEVRGSTFQVCGLWPFSVGSGAPMIGVPLGRHLESRGTVCSDPISWFQRAKLISNPSVFVLGKPGLGKSTLVRRMVTGLAGYGTIPLVLGDIRPDYVDLIRELDGQVITLGDGRGYLNVLDPGEAKEAAQLLTEHALVEAAAAKDAEAEISALEQQSASITDEVRLLELQGRAAALVQVAVEHREKSDRAENLATEVLEDAHSRRRTMVSALLTIARRQPPTDREESIVNASLVYLDEHFDGIPVLADLLHVIQDAPEEVRLVALDRGDIKQYHAITDQLEASLIGLVQGGRLGELFSRQTTERMLRDRPVVYDVSSLMHSDSDLQAAVLLACWSAGFGTVNVSNALAEAGLEPQRHYFVVLDELWRALRAGKGMVNRVDELTRLNRTDAVGMAMISHTMSDLMALPDEADRMTAQGFVERAGYVICGGLPQREMPLLDGAITMSRAEQAMLMSWTDPPAWDPISGQEADPPGRGKFLIKVGGRPGIPVTVELTPAEKAPSDTNRLWKQVSRIGERTTR